MIFYKNELLKEDLNFFTEYDSKTLEGENSSYICSLIRQDSVEKFIAYVHHQNISASSKNSPSIFSLNPFLIDNKNTTLIEYSAFFGSIQIFQYFIINEAELSPSLLLHAIHLKKAELIQLLKLINVNPPNNYEHA